MAGSFIPLSNYIFIPDLTPGFNGLGRDNCKMRQESFKFCDLVHIILQILRYFFLAASTAFLSDSQPPKRKALAMYPICLSYFVLYYRFYGISSLQHPQHSCRTVSLRSGRRWPCTPSVCSTSSSAGWSSHIHITEGPRSGRRSGWDYFVAWGGHVVGRKMWL